MMTRIYASICVFAIVILLQSPAQGQGYVEIKDEDIYSSTAASRIGLTGFAFLKISQGARSVGMGDAYTAISNDINAAFKNPAGLTHMKRIEYVFSYNRWLVNSTVASGAVAANTPYGVVGVTFIGFYPEKSKETTILQPLGTGEMVNAGDVAIGFLYAKKMTDRLSFGVHGRWIQETLHDKKISSYDVSLGTLFYTGFGSSRLAMTLQNFGKDVTPEAVTFAMPMVFNIAAAMEVYGTMEDPTYLTAAVDFSYATDFGERLHFGGELWVARVLALRAGYKTNYDIESYSLGAGVRVNYVGGRQVSVDFAYSAIEGGFDPPLRVSLSGSF